MAIKLIAIDLDGTLLDSKRELSKENKKAIQFAKEKGVQVVLCTGRPLKAMTHLLEEADLMGEEDIAITYNGGLIQKSKTGEIIHEMTHNREENLDIYRLGQELNLPVNFIDFNYIYEPPYPENVPSIYTKSHPKVPKKNALSVKAIDLENLEENFKSYKIVMSRPAEELDAAIPNIPAAYHERYNIFKSQDFILEVLPKKVDKGFSMRLLGEMLGLEKEEIMGIGDQENDLSLVENAGLGIAMGNAIEKVKDAADYITCSNDENGVAHVIEKFVLEKEL